MSLRTSTSLDHEILPPVFETASLRQRLVQGSGESSLVSQAPSSGQTGNRQPGLCRTGAWTSQASPAAQLFVADRHSCAVYEALQRNHLHASRSTNAIGNDAASSVVSRLREPPRRSSASLLRKNMKSPGKTSHPLCRPVVSSSCFELDSPK